MDGRKFDVSTKQHHALQKQLLVEEEKRSTTFSYFPELRKNAQAGLGHFLASLFAGTNRQFQKFAND